MPSLIIVGYVWEILARGTFLDSLHPWAVPKRPILNRVKYMLPSQFLISEVLWREVPSQMLFKPNIHFNVSQRCGKIDIRSRRWSEVVYFNVGVYNIEQRRINAVYSNVGLNNFRQRQSNLDNFIVGQHGSDVVNVTICLKLKIHFKPRTK